MLFVYLLIPKLYIFICLLLLIPRKKYYMYYSMFVHLYIVKNILISYQYCQLFSNKLLINSHNIFTTLKCYFYPDLYIFRNLHFSQSFYMYFVVMIITPPYFSAF